MAQVLLRREVFNDERYQIQRDVSKNRRHIGTRWWCVTDSILSASEFSRLYRNLKKGNRHVADETVRLEFAERSRGDQPRPESQGGFPVSFSAAAAMLSWGLQALNVMRAYTGFLPEPVNIEMQNLKCPGRTLYSRVAAS